VTVSGLVAELLEISSTAERVPWAWGANFTVTSQLPPGATWPMQVLEATKKSSGSEPPKLRPEMLSGAEPPSVIVTVCPGLTVS
jgi:hypothetical protein